MTGRCRHFFAEKNYGFIRIDGSLEDLFFHREDVVGELPRGGQDVNFWLDDDPRKEGKLRAVEVQVAGEDA